MNNIYGKTGYIVKEKINEEYNNLKRVNLFVGEEEPNIPNYFLWVNNGQLFKEEADRFVEELE